jgi:uncharacterized phage protein (TIGR01671 family)
MIERDNFSDKREITEYKFRAWNRYYKEMIPHEKLIDTWYENTRFVFKSHSYEPYKYSLFTAILTDINLRETYYLMQYTGIKDTDGIEIYEGDKVEVTGRVDKAYKGIIVWQNFGWTIKTDNNIFISIDNEIKLKVIGNILEKDSGLSFEEVQE